jgi:hypothetical protein
MLQSRSDARTKSVELTIAIVPARTSFRPLFGKISVFLLLGGNLLRPVEFSSVDPHAMQDDRRLACDRNLGLAEPVALGEPYPKPSRRTISGRVSVEPRLLQTDSFAASRRRIWRFGRTNRPLRRRGVYWSIRHKLPRFSIARTAPDRQSLP